MSKPYCWKWQQISNKLHYGRVLPHLWCYGLPLSKTCNTIDLRCSLDCPINPIRHNTRVSINQLRVEGHQQRIFPSSKGQRPQHEGRWAPTHFEGQKQQWTSIKPSAITVDATTAIAWRLTLSRLVDQSSFSHRLRILSHTNFPCSAEDKAFVWVVLSFLRCS